VHEGHKFIEEIEENGESTLRHVMEIIEMKNNIRFGNAEAYIFVECKFRETEYIDDEFDIEIEDEVKMDIPIKLLTENELEVLIQFYNFV